MMKTNILPVVAVLLSTYNGKHHLSELIESVLAQKNVCVKLIVRDDGSSDGTQQILEKYQLEGKLDWQQGENLGHSGSFMELCKNAPKADYYAFCDQDDIWLPEKLIHGIKELEDHIDVPAMAVCDWIMVDDALSPVKDAESALPFDVDKVRQAGSEQLQKAVCAMNHFATSGCLQIWNNALEQLLYGHDYPQEPLGHDMIVGMLAILCGKFLPHKNKDILYRQHTNNASGSHYGLYGRIYRMRKHWSRILKKAGPNISERNAAILETYRDIIPASAQMFLEQTIHYSDSMSNRIRMFGSDYPTLLRSGDNIKFRLKVLLCRF